MKNKYNMFGIILIVIGILILTIGLFEIFKKKETKFNLFIGRDGNQTQYYSLDSIEDAVNFLSSNLQEIKQEMKMVVPLSSPLTIPSIECKLNQGCETTYKTVTTTEMSIKDVLDFIIKQNKNKFKVKNYESEK